MPELVEADPEAFAAWEAQDKRICLRCGQELPEGYAAACGLRQPCPHCQYMYPLGDCSD